MKIAIAPNAFKGTLTALEAAQCIERGLTRGMRGARCVTIPMADGGDGTAQAIVEATGGELIPARVHDPLGREIDAEWGVTGDGKTAVIEMSRASGLALLKRSEYDPLRTSTRGTGELILAALERGVRKILTGIGGSATNDGGTGMARALGVKFFDRQGAGLPEGGGSLEGLARIDMSGIDPRIQRTEIEVACDVDNPLCGPRGASQIYGPQKEATPEIVRRLDAGLLRLAEVLNHDYGLDVAEVPGAGAAGGMGAGLLAFLGGRLRPGVEIVIDAVGLKRKLRGCDLVITGEGRLDAQTAHGKAPAGVARVAQEMGIHVIAICGSLGADAGALHAAGINVFFSALEESVAEEELPARGPGMLERCAEEVGRMLVLKKKS